MVAVPRVAADGDASQTVKAQLRLRELIVNGGLAPGERLAELALVDRLGVSRTPVRAALLKLQEEGLLEPITGGGFAVRAFSESDIRDAIEVRGTLEGLAARLAAERGVSATLLAEAQQCLSAIDHVLVGPQLSDSAFSTYAGENGRFHALLGEMSGSPVVRRQLERAAAQPFASPNGFVMVREAGAQARDTLVVAQHQHRAVMEAIAQREGTRAESLMREHARLAHGNLSQALQSRQAMARVPGGALIQRYASR
ncbi:MAG: GntR family transcriptional regulator [Rubrivivax sp.]|nr:GntR family transcriptional regulator [Rubrivivax sp.]MDH5338512.1 GntR family transcriptional regulator [Rubrivivax sp.]